MKLKNKRTGEIVELIGKISRPDKPDFVIESYTSLAKLNEEWEDYEEPREYWYINYQGEVGVAASEGYWEKEKRIGNCFETKEEAGRAVEKLKAWKRLKDKGFRFGGASRADASIGLSFNGKRSGINYIEAWQGSYDDLCLLFGGEDE